MHADGYLTPVKFLSWAGSFTGSGSPADWTKTAAAQTARASRSSEDLRNPELRDLLHLGWQRQLDHLTALVQAAVDRGDLRMMTPTHLVARLLLDTASGALLRAAVAPDPAQADPCTAVHDLLKALG